VYLALTVRSKVRHSIVDAPAQEFILAMRDRMLNQTAEKWLKFQTSYLFAKHTRNDVPLVPSVNGRKIDVGIPGILGGAWVYRACRQLLCCPSKKNFRKALDILYSKYGMPRISQKFVQKAIEDHAERFCSAPRALAFDDLIRKDKVKRVIKDTCKQIFSGRDFRPRNCSASQSASFHLGRKDGGAASELLRGFEKVRPVTLDGYDLLERIIELPPFLGCGLTYEVRFPPSLQSNWIWFQCYVDQLCEDIIRRGYILCKPFAIPEPLKVRIITMGEAAGYYRMLDIQKYMHSILRRIPVFRYIGTPVTAEDLSQLGPCQPGELYVSGDYDGATDNLDTDISSYTWRQIAKYGNVPDFYYQLGDIGLTKHRYIRKER